MLRDNLRVLVLLSSVLLASVTAYGQGTTFTYQGKLTDSGNLANGQYDFQLKLFDALSGGAQQGTTQAATNVTVTNAIFTVQIDFGACPTCFNGAARFLEIAVRPGGGGAFTTLTPRQQITATPYALKSQNAGTADGLSVACVLCVTSLQIATVSGSVVIGTIPVASVPAGSGNYIQNQNAVAQSGNFNISGNGNASGTLSGNLINAATEYRLGGLRVYTVNGPFNDGFNIFTASNTFAGDGAGLNTMPSSTLNNVTGKFNSFYGAGAGKANTTGADNAFFGSQAGQANNGFSNAFFGSHAGQANTTGGGNAFFGFRAGQANTGDENAIFGKDAGFNNTTGFANAFFGAAAALNNTTGRSNAFFGHQAGFSNTTGNWNAFFGLGAGNKNTTGVNNTFIGTSANFDISNPTGDNNTLLGASSTVTSGSSNATAIGFRARVEQSNSLILGAITGINGGTDTTVGIGTTNPVALLDVQRDGTAIPEIASFTSYGNITNDLLGRSSNGTRAAPTATTSGTVLLQLGATGHDGTNFVSNPRAIIALDSTEDWTTTANGTRIRFRTTANGTTAIATRMTIDQDGQVGIGTLTPADLLHVTGDIRVGTGTTGCVKDSDGTVIAGSCSSDARLKRDITPFPHLLDELVQLQPVHFYWRSEEFKDRHFGVKPSFGLIAQEVEKVLPELVSEDKQGYKAVNYSKLPLLSLQAIKELKAENDTLKHQLHEQQQQISGQQQEMAAIKKLLCAAQSQADLCKAKSLK